MAELIEENNRNVKLKRIGLPDIFIEQGPRDQICRQYGLSAEGVAEVIRKVF